MALKPFIRPLSALAFIALSACATLTPTPPSAVSGDRDGLSARVLSQGECGLFVWTADSQKRFILFAQSHDMKAYWHGPDGEISLPIESQDGVPTQAQFPQQNYGELTLDLKRPQAIDNGTRYRAGTLTQTLTEQGTIDKWTRVIPVVGLSTCAP